MFYDFFLCACHVCINCVWVQSGLHKASCHRKKANMAILEAVLLPLSGFVLLRENVSCETFFVGMSVHFFEIPK